MCNQKKQGEGEIEEKEEGGNAGKRCNLEPKWPLSILQG